jgi:hypothetical protein
MRRDALIASLKNLPEDLAQDIGKQRNFWIVSRKLFSSSLSSSSFSVSSGFLVWLWFVVWNFLCVWAWGGGHVAKLIQWVTLSVYRLPDFIHYLPV